MHLNRVRSCQPGLTWNYRIACKRHVDWRNEWVLSSDAIHKYCSLMQRTNVGIWYKEWVLSSDDQNSIKIILCTWPDHIATNVFILREQILFSMNYVLLNHVQYILQATRTGQSGTTCWFPIIPLGCCPSHNFFLACHNCLQNKWNTWAFCFTCCCALNDIFMIYIY